MLVLFFSLGEQCFIDVVRELGYYNILMVQVCNSGMFYDECLVCCVNNNCVLVCLVGVKYDVVIVLVCFEFKGVIFFIDVVVYWVEIDEVNCVNVVNYFDVNKVSYCVIGKIFVLVCNGIEMFKLLLMLVNSCNLYGLVNSFDQVGCNMMDYLQLIMMFMLFEFYWFGVGLVVNSGIMEILQGSFCFEYVGVYFCYNNFVCNCFVMFVVLKKGLVGQVLDEEICCMIVCIVDIVLVYEVLFDVDNCFMFLVKKDWLGLLCLFIYYDVGDYICKLVEQYLLFIGCKIV